MSNRLGRHVSWFFLFSLLASNGVQAAPELSLQQIFKDNGPAIVLIGIVGGDGKLVSFGSGFVVTPTGVIVTNHHVIEPKPDARLIVKLANGDTYDDVWVIHDDERRDFAVLLVRVLGLPTVKLGDSDKVEVGEQVVAIGHPEGLEMTFTAGIVSAIRPFPGKGFRFIQHQTPISHGSSGGPLLNMSGEVVGINTFFFEGGQNLNGAVSVNYIKPYLQDPPKMTYEDYARSQGVVPTAPSQPPSHRFVWKTYRNQKYQVAFKYPDWGQERETETPDADILYVFQFTVGCLYSPGLDDPCHGVVNFGVWNSGTHEYWLKKDAERIDFATTAKNHYEEYFKRSLTPTTRIYSMKFFDDPSYGGYQVIFDDSPTDTDLLPKNWGQVNTSSVESVVRIFTKSSMYEIDVFCDIGGSLSECKDISENILANFMFPR